MENFMNENWQWQLTDGRGITWSRFASDETHRRCFRKSEQQELLEVLQSQQQQEIKSLVEVTQSQARRKLRREMINQQR